VLTKYLLGECAGRQEVEMQMTTTGKEGRTWVGLDLAGAVD